MKIKLTLAFLILCPIFAQAEKMPAFISMMNDPFFGRQAIILGQQQAGEAILFEWTINLIDYNFLALWGTYNQTQWIRVNAPGNWSQMFFRVTGLPDPAGASFMPAHFVVPPAVSIEVITQEEADRIRGR